jgi:hypothetical protein
MAGSKKGRKPRRGFNNSASVSNRRVLLPVKDNEVETGYVIESFPIHKVDVASGRNTARRKAVELRCEPADIDDGGWLSARRKRARNRINGLSLLEEFRAGLGGRDFRQELVREKALSAARRTPGCPNLLTPLVEAPVELAPTHRLVVWSRLRLRKERLWK